MVSMTVFKDDMSSETKPGLWTRSERRIWIGTLFTGCAMLYASRTVMPLCVVAMGKELGWDKKQSGTVLSAFFWGYTLTQVIGGYISDRVGGDVVITIAAVGWSLLTFWTPFFVYLSSDKGTVLAIVVFLRVLLGAMQGVHYPGMSSLLSQKIPESERGFSFATITAGSHFGTLICGSLGSVLLETFGWQTAFYAVGLLGMGWLFFLRYYLISKERKKAMILSVKDISPPPSVNSGPVPWLKLFKQPAFWALVAGQSGHTVSMYILLMWLPTYFENTFPTAKALTFLYIFPEMVLLLRLVDFMFLSILVGHFCENNAFFILLSWLPTYFREKFPGSKGWVFNVVPWMVCIPSSIFGGVLADYLVAKGLSITIVRKMSATVALAGVAFFLFLISYTTSYEAALFCMAASIACCGFHGSGILVNPQDIAPQFAGSVFGIMNMAGAIPGFIGVYVAGHILEVSNSWSAVFNDTAVVCVVGWIVYLMFGTGKKIL